MLRAFPKIFQIGQDYISDIFDGEVEITEKLDGCVCLNEPILMKDMFYKKAADLRVGDEVIGFDEGLNNPRFKKSIVTCAKVIKKSCVEVKVKDRIIKVSFDHPFLVRDVKKKLNGLSKRWIDAKDLKKGDRILDLGFWVKDNTYEAGYVAGQFDGEGCVIGVGKNHSTRAIRYYQAPNKGLDRIEKIIKSKGFKLTRHIRAPRKEGWQACESLTITGGMTEFLKFLGTFHPNRLMNKAFSKLLSNAPMNSVNDIEVISVKEIGEKDVLGLSTSSKTYIAKGLLSHNSQFVFGKIKDELFVRSKGQQMVIAAPDKMFQVAVDYVLKIQDKIANNTAYYCEYLRTPHHNVLDYKNTPKNNLALFAVSDEHGNFKKTYEEICEHAKEVDIDVVPIVYKGKIKKADELLKMLETDSYGRNKKT